MDNVAVTIFAHDDHPFVTSNILQFSVDQETDQSICWLFSPRPMAWLMRPQSTPLEQHFDLRGSTPTLRILCRHTEREFPETSVKSGRLFVKSCEALFLVL